MDRSILTRPAPEPDRTLRYGDGPDHLADAWLPSSEGKPLVLFVHGGFWSPEYDRTHTRVLCAALRDEGWPVAAIEYRRTSGRPEHYTEDLRAALSRVPQQMPGAGTVLMGHSAGGHLALWAASTVNDLIGTIALAPVADLGLAHEQRLGDGAVAEFLGGPPSARPDLDPVLLSDPANPVVLVHGAADTGVPVSQSVSYVDAHPMAKLLALPGIAHFELIDPASEAWPSVLAELEGIDR
ncbi:alpha/beta hydrolase family protein [Amycolatopsis pigmentata]|uniref:Alpha/beta hydrolase family protein n=1 Tax=Amycolatopsis pigmentata TaxID=450801 RepID=A0ABW5FQ38_9PSEU